MGLGPNLPILSHGLILSHVGYPIGYPISFRPVATILIFIIFKVVYILK